MKRRGTNRGFVLLGGAMAAAMHFAGPAGAAEDDQLQIARTAELGNLPLLVAEHEKLVEKQADRLGVGKIKVRWLTPGKARGADMLAGGNADFAALDLGTLIAAWDQTIGTPQEVRAVAAVEQMPYVLVTGNPDIHTILDLGDKDKIAVPGPPSAGPGLMLELAAAQQWGPDQYKKLDPLLAIRPDADAASALKSGKADFDAHFSHLPYSDAELGSEAIHRVMDSVDIAGPTTTAVLATTKDFRDANPRVCAALMAALDEADKLIRDNPGQAAEIYVSMVKDAGVAVEELADMVGDPDLGYATAPVGVKRVLDFLQTTGRLKHKPASWKDLFFVEAQNLPGS